MTVSFDQKRQEASLNCLRRLAQATSPCDCVFLQKHQTSFCSMFCKGKWAWSPLEPTISDNSVPRTDVSAYTCMYPGFIHFFELYIKCVIMYMYIYIHIHIDR